MIEITQLYAEAARNEAETAALQRIRWLSWPFEVLFGLGAAAIAVFFLGIFAIGLVGEPNLLQVSHEGVFLVLGGAQNGPVDGVPARSLPLVARVTGALAIILIQGSLIAALISLHKLFGRYRRGIVFSIEPIRLMRQAGFWLILFGLAPGIMQPFVRLTGGLDRHWFHGESLAAILVGLALFVVASITLLGLEIEHERKGYV